MSGRGSRAGRTQGDTANPLPGSAELAGGCFPTTPQAAKKAFFLLFFPLKLSGGSQGEQLAGERGEELDL